ncbi:NAD(P)H-binding protein [Conexibacter woesei]|uniref:NmrA family protein n=1 Tax=Conexibacter woesei (strain DSM 14684 / CCUG 47730 / CIP 108061 / JCM 11494 / NBRC 100937 / ID131577) TaxID=469383 RepID=D3F4H8_CONWI|nr:NAD(P)H-binding protein [Conexibacter woesei]ADB52435.1 NmrA family protein [Conexibacter woesei DSM 14684]
MTTVLATGVRGNTGRPLAALLRDERGVMLRGGSSVPERVELPGVEVVRFSWDDPSSWAPAAAGADSIYIQRPERRDAPELVGALLDEIGDVERVLLLSDNIHGDDVPAGSWEGRVERAVTSRGENWTLLRPTWFQQSLAEPRYLVGAIRDDGVLEIPTAGASIAWVDTRDIAEVALAALLEDGHRGRAYTLTGPRAVTVAELARLIGDAAGHEVRHVDSPLREAVDAFARVEGVDPWYVEYIASVWRLVSNGSAGVVSGDSERITGHPARPLEALVAESAAVWRR